MSSEETPIELSRDYKIREEWFGGILFNRITRQYERVNVSGAKLLSTIRDRPATRAAINHFFDDSMEGVGDFIDSCIRNGIVKESENRETSSLVKFDNRKVDKPISAPLFFVLNPTMKCPMRCDFCYLDDNIGSLFPDEMSFQKAKVVFDVMKEREIFELNVVGW